MPIKWSEDELRIAVAKSCSMADALRYLGIVPKGDNYKTIRTYINRLGLDISHFTGIPSQKRSYPKVSLDELLTSGRYVTTSHLKKRLLDEGILDRKCYECGLTEWRGKPIPIELEHIDGDNCNNRRENLTLLCPNCHALTPTYRGRNVGRRAATERASRPPLPEMKCCVCGGKTKSSDDYRPSRCEPCFHKSQERIEWPDDARLLEMLKASNFYRLGKELGVSDKAIRKRLSRRGLI